MKRLATIALCLLLILATGTVLFSCKGNSDPNRPQNGVDFVLDAGEGAYTIVRSDAGSTVVTSNVRTLRKAIESLYGFSPASETDAETAALSEQEITARKEILVGETNRPESARALASLKDNEYTIRVDGNKLVIVGKTNDLTVTALRYFLTDVLGTKSTVSADFIHTAQAAGQSGWGTERPCIVTPQYENEDIIVANVIATDDYGADPTGYVDSSDAIQKALNACSKLGGGVVYLPVGRYLVTKTITIPQSVVLHGDWQDPDVKSDDPGYGTVIIARPTALTEREKKDLTSNPLFDVRQTAGVIGLTVYYPDQNPTDAVPYGFTFLATEFSTITLRNITMINSYRGISVRIDHEFTQLENIRMCALETGVTMTKTYDVGNVTGIHISPSYWTEANGNYRCTSPEDAELQCFTRTIGMTLGQLDDETISDIKIDGCHTGILFESETTTCFWGLLYDVNISSCYYGIRATGLNRDAGAVIAFGRVEGLVAAIDNKAPEGALKLCGVETIGEVTGRTLVDDVSDISAYTLRKGTYKKPASHLYVVPLEDYKDQRKDAAPVIQKVLDSAAATGGVVYIPAGHYHLKSPLTVPAGVQLTGAMPIMTRDDSSISAGTVLLSYVNDGALITLGENAGVRGVRIWYPYYDARTAYDTVAKNPNILESCVAIKGTGSGVYVLDSLIASGFTAVDFSDCDNHLIDHLYGCCYYTQAIVGGENGVVQYCMQGRQIIGRCGLVVNYFDPFGMNSEDTWRNQSTAQDLLGNGLLRTYSSMYQVRDAKNQYFNHCFMFSPDHFATISGSSVYMTNVSTDFMHGAQFVVRDNSTLTVVNALRSCGASIRCDDSSTADIYNRIAISNYLEGPYHSSASDPTSPWEKEWTKTITISDCDSTKGVSGVSLTTQDSEHKQGTGAWKATYSGAGATVDVVNAKFSAVDISDCYENGYLHISLYVNDYRWLKWGGQISLYSESGERIYWSLPAHLLQDGWNELYLPFYVGIVVGGDGEFNPEKVTSFRINCKYGNFSDKQTVFFIDDIYACK